MCPGVDSAPENEYHVCRMYTVAAILLLQFIPHVMAFPVINILYCYITSHSMCAVPNTAVFCSSLILCFPGMLLRYFLNDVHMVPIATVVLVSLLFSHFTCAVLLVKVFVFWDLISCSVIIFLFPKCAGYDNFVFL